MQDPSAKPVPVDPAGIIPEFHPAKLRKIFLPALSRQRKAGFPQQGWLKERQKRLEQGGLFL
jgi:hypothetical protein